MSAGNVVLGTFTVNASTTPYSLTLLGVGNYWIEEIDFIFTYFQTNAATTTGCTMSINGSIAYWQQIFLLNSTAAALVPLNIPIISRPRIFLSRGANLIFNINAVAASVTSIIGSISLYGRSLP